LFVLCAVGIIGPGIALAQASIESRKLPSSFLKGVKARTALAGDSISTFGNNKNGGKGKSSTVTIGLPGVDSIVNWSDQFIAPGFDSNGNPQTVWPYTMVGTPPESGQSTFINAPIIPMELDLLDSTGNIATFYGQPLVFKATPDLVSALVNSPIFAPYVYDSGFGQFNDQMLRTEFWNRIHPGDGDWDNGWHNFLLPSVKRGRVMQIPFNFWYFFYDANNNPVAAAVDANTFGNLLFPATYPFDNSTPVGAAEHAGDITTQTMATFFFNNVYLYEGTINNCCILGYHTYDDEPGIPANGNRDRRYVLNYSSWITNGLFYFGIEDITAVSHEISETFNDPFGNNETPWWLSVDPFLGSGNCQNNLEVGDVVEVLTANEHYSASLNGMTYHPQNMALLQWFELQSPSTAFHGAFSFPDETTLTAPSPSNLLPGCAVAP